MAGLLPTLPFQGERGSAKNVPLHRELQKARHDARIRFSAAC
jgi:hypothetical protein